MQYLMIRILLTYSFLILLATTMLGQRTSIKELEAQLKKVGTTQEQMMLNYELGRAYLKSNKKKAEDHAYKAALDARKLNDKEMAARAYFLNAQAKLKGRDRKGARTRFNTSFDYAKKTNNPALVLEVLEELVAIEKRLNNYKAAYSHTEAALEIIKNSKQVAASSPPPSYSGTSSVLKDNRALAQEKQDLENEIQKLQEQRSKLATDKSSLTERQKELEEEKSSIEEEKSNIEAEKEEIAATVAAKEARINKMSNEQVRAKAKILEKEQAINALKIKKQEQDLTIMKAKERNSYLLLGSALGSFVMLFLFLRYRSNLKARTVLLEKNKLIEDERERSDDLLKNILPASIAEELKEHGKAKAQRYENATVMFSDFVNFTKISEQLTPEQLVQELDTCFRGFDQIIAQYKLEKIKTIGDAYMVAHGLKDRVTVPLDIIKAAIDMQEFLEDLKAEKMRQGLPYFEARIGIHSGPVVAGVVGLNKFAYDIWGDTVNIAARMEANCDPGKVNISEKTYSLVKYNFNCRYRGKISAKNKGQIDMYYVESKVTKSVPSFV